MNLLTIYNLLSTGEITEEQAAESLGFSVRGLRTRISHHGHKLPLVLATLDKIKSDQIKRVEAAEVLGTTERNINYLMESWNIIRPIVLLQPYLVHRAEVEVRWELRKKFAIDVIEGIMSFVEAGEKGGCTDRQMRRWVSDLLEQHYGMVYKDLIKMELPKRRRLAEEIRTAEQLERAKQKMVEAISDGSLSVKTEATKRVLDKRKVKKESQ